MKKILILLFLLTFIAGPLMATHQRAGEITFRYISGTTYEVTIVTYSYAPSEADRPTLFSPTPMPTAPSSAAAANSSRLPPPNRAT